MRINHLSMLIAVTIDTHNMYYWADLPGHSMVYCASNLKSQLSKHKSSPGILLARRAVYHMVTVSGKQQIYTSSFPRLDLGGGCQLTR